MSRRFLSPDSSLVNTAASNGGKYLDTSAIGLNSSYNLTVSSAFGNQYHPDGKNFTNFTVNDNIIVSFSDVNSNGFESNQVNNTGRAAVYTRNGDTLSCVSYTFAGDYKWACAGRTSNLFYVGSKDGSVRLFDCLSGAFTTVISNINTLISINYRIAYASVNNTLGKLNVYIINSENILQICRFGIQLDGTLTWETTSTLSGVLFNPRLLAIEYTFIKINESMVYFFSPPTSSLVSGDGSAVLIVHEVDGSYSRIASRVSNTNQVAPIENGSAWGYIFGDIDKSNITLRHIASPLGSSETVYGDIGISINNTNVRVVDSSYLIIRPSTPSAIRTIGKSMYGTSLSSIQPAPSNINFSSVPSFNISYNGSSCKDMRGTIATTSSNIPFYIHPFNDIYYIVLLEDGFTRLIKIPTLDF